MQLVAGIDEAGRGALAGPVVAACVILPPTFPVNLLADSKCLSHKRRSELVPLIKQSACYGIGSANEKIIDQVNILRATFRAMKAAFDAMQVMLPNWIAATYPNRAGEGFLLETIVDGNQLPFAAANIRAQVKADAVVPCVQAASILAKVQRDQIMVSYATVYPGWGYERHKGYPTRSHKEALRRLGPSPIQRLTFRW